MQFQGDSIIFGNPSDFAIEAGVDELSTQVWGHMCVWCRGIALGDLTDPHCGMAGAAGGFRQLAEQLDDLWDESLASLTDQQLWDFLDERLYGYRGDVQVNDDRTLAQIRGDCDRFWRFDFLTNWDEMFDRHKAFLVCPPGQPVRVLCREFPVSVGLAVEVSRDGVRSASAAFVRWYEQQNERLPRRTA